MRDVAILIRSKCLHIYAPRLSSRQVGFPDDLTIRPTAAGDVVPFVAMDSLARKLYHTSAFSPHGSTFMACMALLTSE